MSAAATPSSPALRGRGTARSAVEGAWLSVLAAARGRDRVDDAGNRITTAHLEDLAGLPLHRADARFPSPA